MVAMILVRRGGITLDYRTSGPAVSPTQASGQLEVGFSYSSASMKKSVQLNQKA